MRPGRPRLPVRELSRINRIADVPDQNAFLVWFVRIGAPAGRRLLQRRHHMLSCSVIWMVQVFPGPGIVFTNFGSFGSVTSTMLQP